MRLYSVLTRPFATLAVVAAFASGCESDSTGPDDEDLIEGEVALDASSNTAFTYFSLSTGQVVQVTNPTTSQDWDLAIRRYEVRLNGGVAGPKDVGGFNLQNNATATSAQVLAFTAENQKPAFDAVGVAQIPAATSFLRESLSANPLGWLSFGAQGPVANANAVWKVKRSTTGHALVRMTGLTLSGATLASVTIEFRYQPNGGTLGAKQTATLQVGTTPAINLETGAASAATGCLWDLQFDAAQLALTPNVNCGAGTSPLDVSQTFDGATTAADALQYGAFLAGKSGAIPFNAALTDPKGPFLYNLGGDNRLSPTFNTYLVRSGTATYKFQLINYYNATGASGFPTIRFARLQ